MFMKRYCLTLDLKDDPELIAEYKRHHRAGWPEIKASIVGAGVVEMEIYLLGRRLCMVMEVDDSFSFEAKAAADLANPKVQEWETLMLKYQEPLAMAKPGEKWMLMEKIFSLTEAS
jgi:L-rhamnose mutarotase